MTTPNRGLLWGVAAIWVAGACERSAPHDSSVPPEPARDPPGVVVVETRGGVEARRAGQWGQAQVGDRLSDRDAVRSGVRGAAKVAIGQGASLEVQPASEVTFGEVQEGRARVRLERGRVCADLAGDDLLLAVESAGSDAVAEASSGSFSLFNDGRGSVAVAARAGEVRLQGRGGEVALAAGERATVQPDQQPGKEPVPDSVYLKVRWPEERLTRETSVTLLGTTDASARVDINGVPVEVAPDGTFVARVPLQDGHNDLCVRATDLSDRITTEDSSVVLRRRAPRAKAKSEGIWE